MERLFAMVDKRTLDIFHCEHSVGPTPLLSTTRYESKNNIGSYVKFVRDSSLWTTHVFSTRTFRVSTDSTKSVTSSTIYLVLVDGSLHLDFHSTRQFKKRGLRRKLFLTIEYCGLFINVIVLELIVPQDAR